MCGNFEGGKAGIAARAEISLFSNADETELLASIFVSRLDEVVDLNRVFDGMEEAHSGAVGRSWSRRGAGQASEGYGAIGRSFLTYRAGV